MVKLLQAKGKMEEAAALMREELSHLDLGVCRIGDDDAETLAAFLKDDQTLKKLFLYGNDVGPLGCKALADGLKHNTTLLILHLRSNLIGEEGATALIGALSHNVCIADIGLLNTGIAPETTATVKYLTGTRNKTLIPAAVRRVSLYLIAARNTIADAGMLSIFPTETVKMILRAAMR